MSYDTKVVPSGDRFDIDVANSSGLSLRIRGGVILNGLGFKSAPNATIALTASASNFIEADDAGAISANTSGFTSGATPLYVVTTNASVVSGVEDWRGDGRPSKTQAITADAAIRDDAEFVTLNSSGTALAVTLAAPAPGRFLVISQIDTGTDGHAVTLSAGTWDGTNDVATFNAAAETLVVFGVSATRFAIVENIGAVALS